MKNQYFADINDYLKYGILRAIANSKLKICLCWMLNEDDRRRDGGKIQYTQEPDKWRMYDPVLFDVMKWSIKKNKRSIDVAEKKSLIPNATYHPTLLTDDRDEREQYFKELTDISAASDLIFFDADNGMEVKSVKKGNKNSSKYLYWDEVERFTDTHSILIFQYFPRKPREKFIEETNQRLKAVSSLASVMALITAHVGFFLVLHPLHERRLKEACREGIKNWDPHIRIQLENFVETELIRMLRNEVKSLKEKEANLERSKALADLSEKFLSVKELELQEERKAFSELLREIEKLERE
jgi:hypothetical protein